MIAVPNEETEVKTSWAMKEIVKMVKEARANRS